MSTESRCSARDLRSFPREAVEVNHCLLRGRPHQAQRCAALTLEEAGALLVFDWTSRLDTPTFRKPRNGSRYCGRSVVTLGGAPPQADADSDPYDTTKTKNSDRCVPLMPNTRNCYGITRPTIREPMSRLRHCSALRR